MKRALLAASFLSCALAAPTFGQPTEITGTLRTDTWHYPFNATPGSRAIGPLFITTDPTFPQFDLRDGVAILQWDLEVPPALDGLELEVVSATITYYDEQGANWPLSETNSLGLDSEIQLFAAGFGPVHTEESWTGSWASLFGPPPGDETDAFQGGYIIPGQTPVISTDPRDPFPRDLLTDENVANNGTTATSWATPIIDPGYTPGGMSDAVPVSFELDVTERLIQFELREDLASGISSWIVSSTYDLTPAGAGPGEPSTNAPQLIFSEGASDTGLGTSQMAPSLVIEVQEAPTTSAANWELYQ